MRKIHVIEKSDKDERHPLRVAAYCRVSKKSDELLNSLENQIKYYEKTINDNHDWILVKIYHDIGSGLRTKKRDGYKQLLIDCKKSKIDMILVKSFSRFGRDFVELVRSFNKLKQLNIKIQIEGEMYNMTSSQSSLAIIMAYSQEESRIKSENIKWGIEKRMQQGKAFLNHKQFLGYTKDNDGSLIVVPDEAKVVRRIFEMYANGNGTRKIKKYLEDNGVKTVTGKSVWSTATIDRMLDNEKYIGQLLLQKTFVPDFLTGKQIKNDGDKDMYFVENSHESIIDEELWKKVRIRKDRT